MNLIDYLTMHCKPVDERGDDIAVYRNTKLIAGRYPETRKFNTLLVHHDRGVVEFANEEEEKLRPGALSREVALMKEAEL
jgi:hypothetical protein